MGWVWGECRRFEGVLQKSLSVCYAFSLKFLERGKTKADNQQKTCPNGRF
ncbi:hypothetical protein HMPREF9371_2525, partial [Neisseria shayeganii 871]